jgi:hypothetical protein
MEEMEEASDADGYMISSTRVDQAAALAGLSDCS